MIPPGALSPIRGDSLEGSHSFRSKVTWPELQRISIRRTRSVDLGQVDISQLTVVVSGAKFTKFFVQRGRDGIVDNAVYRLSISLSIPEIFALKVESCPKSRRILDVFRYPKF